MSDLDRQDRVVEAAELWRRLEDLEDGTLDAVERDALMDLLRDSPAARRLYREYFIQVAELEAEAATREEQGRLPVLATVLRTRRMFQRSVMAGAAALVVMAVVAAFIMIRQPEPGRLTAAVAAETQWMVDGEVHEGDAEGLEVVEGSVVRVLSGTIRLEMETGANIALQGPAEVYFRELTRPVLRKGWLWIDAGEADEPFAVEAAGLVVRDIGTRFGVRVDGKGGVEVHVIEGVVEVSEQEANRPPVLLKPGSTGSAVDRFGTWTEVVMARDPFPGLPDLLAAQTDYPTTVLSQSPVGYWRLEDEFIGEVVNEIPGGSVGSHSFKLKPGEPGVRDGFGGFPEDNQAIRLRGEEEEQKSVLFNIDGPGGVSKEEGAVAFWVRCLSGGGRPEMLWYAGQKEVVGPDSPDMMFVHLTPTGRLGFFMENRKYDVLLSSTRVVADGDWHHVVASWDASAVALFVDGKQVALDSEFRGARDGVFSGRDIRFGKVGSAGAAVGLPMQPFAGWVDEVALWNRSLTAAEVWHQYQSALGAE